MSHPLKILTHRRTYSAYLHIYKQEKINYILEYKKTSDRDPDENELKGFHTASIARIRQYQSQAAQQLTQFSNELTRERLSDFKDNVFQEYSKGHTKRLNAIIKKQNIHDLNCKRRCTHTKAHVFWRWAYSGVIGNASFIISIAIVMLISSLFSADPVGNFLKNTFQHTEKSSSISADKPQPPHTQSKTSDQGTSNQAH